MFDDQSTSDEENANDDKSNLDTRANKLSWGGSHCDEYHDDSMNSGNDSQGVKGSDDISDGGGKVGPAPYIRKSSRNEDDWDE